MTKIVLILGRHGYPMGRAARQITDGNDGLDQTKTGSWRNPFYVEFHSARAEEINKALAAPKAANHDFNEGLGSPIDGMLTRQTESSITLAAKKLHSMLDANQIPLPIVAISSQWLRTQTTGSHYLRELYQEVDTVRQKREDGTFRVQEVIDPTIGPAGGGKIITPEGSEPPDQEMLVRGIQGPEIFKTLAENPDIKKAYDAAVARGEKTVTIQVTSHDSGPYNMMSTLMGQKRLMDEPAMSDFNDRFLGVAPLAGVAVVEIEVDSLKDLNKFKTMPDGSKNIDIPENKINFVGYVVPREEMADVVDNMEKVLEAAKIGDAYKNIAMPSFTPPNSKWTLELINELIKDLHAGAKVLRDDDERILEHLYKKSFVDTPSKSAKQHQQAAIDTLRNWSLAMDFVQQASRVRENLGDEFKEALNTMGDHQTVGEKMAALGRYTEVSLSERLWSRRPWEGPAEKETLQPRIISVKFDRQCLLKGHKPTNDPDSFRRDDKATKRSM